MAFLTNVANATFEFFNAIGGGLVSWVLVRLCCCPMWSHLPNAKHVLYALCSYLSLSILLFTASVRILVCLMGFTCESLETATT